MGRYRYVAAYGFHGLSKNENVQTCDYADCYNPINSRIKNYKAVKKIEFPR